MTSHRVMRELPPRLRRATQVAGVAAALALSVTFAASSNLSAQGAHGGRTSSDRLFAADREPQNWLTTGRTYDEARYSPLTQLNDANVSGLGLAWSYDLDTNRGQESTPLVVDGKIYTTSAWSKVQAFDAVSGKLLWQFDPRVPGPSAVKACCDVVNRGAAYWEGRVFVGTIDGRLIAIDAATGKQVWATVTVDQSKPYTITGAPRVVRGRVLIGNGGAELGVRGYVSAYDAMTGKLAWRFYTVPGRPGTKDGAASDTVLGTLAAKTWAGEWWGKGGGGGGTVWDSMAYDPELDLLYIGVGNASYWNKQFRSDGKGDNLFVSSIVALRPETGEYVWHFQETPGDSWDYTSTQNMILTDLTIDGKRRKTLIQAPKNGFFYVIDRETGKFIQAKPYIPLNWAKGLDPVTGRPVMNPDAEYWRTGKPWLAMPGGIGGHNWQPMAFNRDTGLVYIPVHELGGVYKADSDFKPLPVGGTNLGIDVRMAQLPEDLAQRKAVLATLKGYLLAWDPIAQKERWRAPNAGFWNGGVLTTAGNLVIQGDNDGFLNVYDARTGRKLWHFDCGSSVMAAPVSYSVNGKQYVTVVVGYGGAIGTVGGGTNLAAGGQPRVNKSRVLTFMLNGRAQLAPRAAAASAALDPPPQFADAATIQQGAYHYARTCSVCHGSAAVSGGVVPDLRHSGFLGEKDGWYEIVGRGALEDQGMANFSANYSPQQIEAIRAYVIARAQIDATEAGTR